MMKTKSLIASLVMIAASVMPMAAKNDIVTVQFENLPYTYVEPQKPAEEPIQGTFPPHPRKNMDIKDMDQEGKTKETHQEGFASHVNSDVKAGVSAARRVTLVDESSSPMYLVTGEIPMISTSTVESIYTVKDKEGKETKKVKYMHGANITVSLTLKNLTTGKIITQTFRASESPSEKCSENEALSRASNSIRNKIRNYLNNKFSLTATIIERGEPNKDKEKEVYIDLGTANGVSKGLEFDVYQIGQIAGRETRTKIGTLEIEEVLGRDISLCKVEKGKKEIKIALDAGENVYAVSSD